MKTWLKYFIALIVLILLILAPLMWVHRKEIIEILVLARTKAEELGRINPIYLILAIAILPTFGIPVSFLYIVAGLAYGFILGLLYSIIGVTINTSLCYWLANSFMKEWIIQLLHKRGHKLIQIPPKEYTTMTLAVRLMPGIPLAAQSYLLGLAGVPFIRYALLTLPVEIFWATFFILPTKTFVAQKTQSFILVGVGIIVLCLIIKIVRDILKKNKLN